MKKIQILGTGCAKCENLAENARKAIEAVGVECEVEKVKDLNEIMKFGVMITPALAIDGQVKFSGKVAEVDEIAKLLKE